MRILFLDDARVRHDAFTRRHIGDEVVHVFTAAEANRALDELPRFDPAHLDHDLAEEHYLTLSEGLRETPAPGYAVYERGTGMDVVDHVIAMPSEKRPGRMVVHTFNPRRREMVDRLESAGVVASWVTFGAGQGTPRR